jgi:hypothetical protein
MGIDSSAVAPRSFAQWVEVKRLQRSFQFHLAAVVRHQQITIDEPDIGLHAAKPAFERVEQRALVFVVVVGVGAREWLGRFSFWQRAGRLG